MTNGLFNQYENAKFLNKEAVCFYTDIWLSSFAKTPHPFNSQDDRKDLESDILAALNRTKQNPVERDLIDNPFVEGADQVVNKEIKSSKKSKKNNSKSIIDPGINDARSQAKIRDEYTPSQISAIKRKQALRGEALGLDTPSTVLPSTTRGVELEGAYKSMRDPVVQETIGDVAKLDRYKRQKSGQLKPHEQKLPKIKLKEAEALQSKLQTAKQENPDMFSNLQNIYQSVNNTVEQAKPVEKTIPAAFPGDTTAVKPNVVKGLKARAAANPDQVYTPSYVSNPPSIAYTADLKRRTPEGDIVDPSVVGIDVNREKTKPLKVKYTPTTKGAALKGRLTTIQNVSGTLDESLLSPSEKLLRQGSDLVETVSTQAKTLPSKAINLLQAARKKISIPKKPLRLLPKSISQATPPATTPSANLTAEQTKAMLAKAYQQPSAITNTSPPFQPVVNLPPAPSVPTVPVTPSIPVTPPSVNVPVPPAPNVIANAVPTPTPQASVNSIGNKIAEQLSNVSINTPLPPISEPIKAPVVKEASQVATPVVNKLTSITNKWRLLPKEQKFLAKVGTGLAASGALLIGQNKIADNIARKNQDQEVERQRLLYSPQPVQSFRDDSIDVYN